MKLLVMAPAPPTAFSSPGHGGGPVPLAFAVPFTLLVVGFLAVILWKAWKLTRDL